MQKIIRLIITGVLSLFLCVSLPWTLAQAQSPPLIQAGQAHYQAGRYADAAQSLGLAATTYRQTGQPLPEARTLGLQALAFEKLGNWPAANAAIDRSLALITQLKQAAPQSSSPEIATRPAINLVEAQVLSSQGELLRSQGEVEVALQTWERAESLYQQEEDMTGVLGSRINQIKALEALGFYRRAETQLEAISHQLNTLPDSPIKAKGLLSLGTLQRLEGQLQTSEKTLSEGIRIAQAQQEQNLQSQLLFSLANTERLAASRLSPRNTAPSDSAQRERAAALIQSATAHYQTAAQLTRNPTEQAQIELNHFSLLLAQAADGEPIEPGSPHPLKRRAHQLLAHLEKLPVNRHAIYAKVNFIQQVINAQPKGIQANADALKQNANFPDLGLGANRLQNLLQQTIEQADALEDERSQSYALGTLGHWFETQGNLTEAEALSQLALRQAQDINAPEIAYQWQWQLGRILQSQATFSDHEPSPRAQQALKQYEAAYQTLNLLRSDLVSLAPDIQFSFREQVEPVYRELVDLLLQDPNQDNLIQARNVIEDLQLAELDNFFRDACAQVQPRIVDDIDPSAAIIYPILLRDRLEIILKLPGDTRLRHFVQPNITPDQIAATVQDFRRLSLRRSSGFEKFAVPAEQLYQWLIKPLETDLEAQLSRETSQIKTLSFVLDGALQGLPIAALFDGEHFLVERYGIAITPGLQLLDPQRLARQNLQILLGGAEDAPSFTAEGLEQLQNVPFELQEIKSLFSQNELLTGEAFKQQNISDQIDNQTYNIVHFATHGQFSSDPEQTFILDWDKRINVAEFDGLLRFSDPTKPNAIELLVLSACETARGDRRAALGLAGVSIRAGARSTLATLWQVNDASTAEFMIKFYQQLKETDLTKAEALRNTQLSFLRDYPNQDFDRPYHWAPFILVGNWL